MGHPGFAVIFVAGSYQVSDIDGNGGFGGVGKQKGAKSVVEAVFRDSLDGRYTGDAFGRLPLGECHAGGGQHEE
jgi:hypothetical protein